MTIITNTRDVWCSVCSGTIKAGEEHITQIITESYIGLRGGRFEDSHSIRVHLDCYGKKPPTPRS